VALFVVACGALLMLGGAIALLMGFDIVMTERGAAMTIGGTVALSGGAVTVGVGFALLRLSQILRVLEARGGKAGRAGVADRPVVPIAPPEAPAGLLPDEPEPKAAIPVAAGVTMAAAAGAAAIGFAGSASADDRPAAIDEPPPRAGPPPPVVSAPPDLEAELAQALAETDPPPPTPTKRSFADGLSAVLAKPIGRRGKVAKERAAKDFEPVETQAEAPEELKDDTQPEATIADVANQDEVQLEETLPEKPAVGATMAVPETAATEHASSTAAQEPETELTAPDSADDDAKDSKPASVTMPEAEAESESVPALPEATAIPPRLKSGVLGTYNVGGRVYSMFADGSVEAVTEAGVERFRSMEELRRHLART
jgi:hypothetical protein